MVNAQNDMWINDVNEINHLEYYLEFSPNPLNDYSTTKYGLDITSAGPSEYRIAVSYEDPSITKANDNYEYQVSISSNLIASVSLNFYKPYITSTHSELFLDLGNVGNPQIFRVDETVVFADYLKRGHFKEVRRIDTSFNYIGIESLTDNFLQTFMVYHYDTTYNWISDGIY
jgi:hypothetical protein